MKVLTTLLCALLLSGCATPHRTGLAVTTLATVADVYTTRRGFDNGCYEANPIYGTMPSDEKLVGLNIGAIAIMAAAAVILEKGNGPTWPFYVVAAVRGAAAINNHVNCG